MADAGLDVAVIGATGAVGRDLIVALERSPLPVARWILVSSATKNHTSVEVGGRSVPVLPGAADSVPEKVLDEADLVFFATPAPTTRTLAPRVLEAGIAAIDIGAAMADHGPIVVPLAGIFDEERFHAHRIACSPSAPAVLAAAVLGPLSPFGVTRAQATVLLPAGIVGTAGPEELSRQVVALFNSSDPPRKMFPRGLAFDVLGAVGQPEHDWTGAERRVSTELAALLRIPPDRLPFTLLLVPTMAGVSMNLQVHLHGEVDAERVRGVLDAVPLLRVGDPVASPLQVTGTATAHVGRIRDDPSGSGVHLWAVADNLRFCASANAVSIALHLWREDLL